MAGFCVADRFGKDYRVKLVGLSVIREVHNVKLKLVNSGFRRIVAKLDLGLVILGSVLVVGYEISRGVLAA